MPATGPLLVNLGACAGAALVAMLVAFAIGASARRHRVVDVFWGLAFAAVALTTLGLSAGHGNHVRRYLITALTVAWGVRLAAHIARRSRGKGEDPRYQDRLSRGHGHPDLYALRVVYLTQAATAWFISWPIQVGQYDPDPLGAVGYLGVALFAVGLFFEAVGDAQLARFKREAAKRETANKGHVMDRGLWRYTRHPNYFGDACVWWGLWLVAGISWAWLISVVSPLLMTYLLTRTTGKPLLEARMRETRPGYAEYIRRTSGFIPLPPKR